MLEPTCENLRTELQGIRELKTQFDVALEVSVRTGDLEVVKTLKQQLTEQAAFLRGKLWPFEHLSRVDLHRNYENQVSALATTKVIEQLPDGKMGIVGIDGEGYQLPDFETVVGMVKESQEKLGRKIEQGFSRLLLVPIGQSLDTLSGRFGEAILAHHRSGKLFATKKDPSEANQALALDESKPLWRWDEYNNSDVNGKLVYYPQKYKRSHGGLTKQTLLEKTRETKTPGWQVLLIEDMPNIPRQNQGATVGDRPQLDTGGGTPPHVAIEGGNTFPSPSEYLKTLQENPTYADEAGLTPEDWLTYAITHLEETNQVVDDYQGNGSVAYLLGAYFPTTGSVPNGCWNRGSQQARLGGSDPGKRNDILGARSAVRVEA